MALGLRVALKDEKDAWKVALAGPITSAILAMGFYLALPGIYAFTGFMVNLWMVVINMIPIKIADGGHVLAAIRRRSD
jgi:Zn-dependent protease